MKYKNKLALISVLILSIFTFSCASKETKNTEDNTTSINVILGKSAVNTKTVNMELTGQVESAHASNIATRIMGYVTKIYVKVGDKVNAGQLLFSINSTDILAKKGQVDASVRQAEAALHVAQKDFDRYTVLYKQASASAKELEQVNLQYQSAKSGVDAAKSMQAEVIAQLTYANVVAPFSGVITQKLADEGSLANPGMPILTIEQSGTLQISAMAPENSIANLKLGENAAVTISAANINFIGKITQINPSSQLTGGQYIIKVSIPNTVSNKVLAGMYANLLIQNSKTVKLDTNSYKNLLVPASAIIYRDQLTGIYTVGSQNTALLRWVRLGNNFGNNIEVLSGLAKEESYIISADGKLFNGAKIKIK